MKFVKFANVTRREEDNLIYLSFDFFKVRKDMISDLKFTDFYKVVDIGETLKTLKKIMGKLDKKWFIHLGIDIFTDDIMEKQKYKERVYKYYKLNYVKSKINIIDHSFLFFKWKEKKLVEDIYASVSMSEFNKIDRVISDIFSGKIKKLFPDLISYEKLSIYNNKFLIRIESIMELPFIIITSKNRIKELYQSLPYPKEIIKKLKEIDDVFLILKHRISIFQNTENINEFRNILLRNIE